MVQVPEEQMQVQCKQCFLFMAGLLESRHHVACCIDHLHKKSMIVCAIFLTFNSCAGFLAKIANRYSDSAVLDIALLFFGNAFCTQRRVHIAGLKGNFLLLYISFVSVFDCCAYIVRFIFDVLHQVSHACI